MDIEKKLQLIKRNTAEIVTEKELIKLLETKKNPSLYLGTAITGRPHIGYFIWVIKMADFMNAGFKVKLLLADLHGALDGTQWDILEKRYKYYSKTIQLMFKSIGANPKNLEIVKGSEFQLKKDFFFDILKLSTIASIHDCKRAASEVVKFGKNPKLSGLIYPIMQALDEVYLNVDIQYGGIDQRKILMFAREFLPKLGYKSRIEIMTPIIPGLIGKKMSATEQKSKIDLMDDEATVQTKIRGAYCEPGVIEDNGILAFTKYVIMTIKQDRKEEFTIERPEKYGGNVSYANYEKLEKDYLSKDLSPPDLKNAVAKEINIILKPFREENKELVKLSRAAYT